METGENIKPLLPISIGKKEAMALVNTGADVSCISRKLAHELQMDFR